MDKKITTCKIEKGGLMNYITAIFDDASEMIICSYYPDELSFTEDEFIGLTIYQARDLYQRKDLAYLRG